MTPKVQQTLNRIPAEERQRFGTRVRELATGGGRTRDAVDVLVKEFPGVRISISTLQNMSNREGFSFSGGSAVAGETKQEKETDRQRFLQDVMGQAAQFVRDRRPLIEVPAYLHATKVEDMGFDTEQESLALFSDLHYYSKIDRRASNGLAEYNIDIARHRLARWRNGVLRFTQMDQIVIDLKRLNIFALGDDLEGHGEMFASQALQMSESIIFQVMGFVEDMTEIILSFLERYETIRIIKVPGNHGRVAARARGSYTPDNFETMAWELIAERIRNQTGGVWSTSLNGVRSLTGGKVDFHIHYGAIAFVNVLGWLCAARHGHGIKGLQSTYTGAQDNKFRLNAVIGEIINWYFKAHLHEAQSSESEIRGEIIQNGCFVGPSLLSIEMSRAAANLPSQEFMLFHPKRGKTHHYRIHLAEVDEVRQFEVIGRDDLTEVIGG